MNALVALILIGALGIIAGRFLFLRPRPGSWYERFILSGAEFLVIGAVIGPSGLAVLDEKTLVQLEPFLLLALAWIGLLIGLQLRWAYLVRFPWAFFQVAGIQAAVAGAVTFAGLGFLFFLWTPMAASASDAWRGALCLATVATLSSPAEAMRHRRTDGGHVVGLLRFVPAVDPLVAILGVGVLFAVWHGPGGNLGMDLGTVHWMLVSVGGGIVLGALFLLLLASVRESDERVLVVLGMALFSGGLASVFHLSPLVVCLFEGIVLANGPVRHDHLMHLFLRMERPLYVALLVLAGASWRFMNPWGYALAGMFLVLKFAGKFLGTKAALAVTPLPFTLPRQWWMGLTPQDAMAVAIAVSYDVIYADRLAETVISAVLISTVTFSFLSQALVERALRPETAE
jgi:Kef-type K+ transport system membrane component KefB